MAKSPKKSDFPLVSIIVRTKDEERWIGSCLRAVFNQSYPNFEVILVDNRSTDQTVAKASKFDVKVVEIKKFIPGKAINDGIRASSGDILVCLSGHCIPVDENWLGNLVRNLEDDSVAGVYGRQQPLSFSSDFDKRDLLITFSLDRKVQVKDSFFHNANSAFPRAVWEKFPFDEEATNIEDRIWAKQVQFAGHTLVYEPEASVYHYHGIHQDLNPERAAQVVRIMEQIDGPAPRVGARGIDELNIIAIIPTKGPQRMCDGEPLFAYTIREALAAKRVDKVIVATDNEKTAALARELGAETPFMRPPGLSEDYVDVSEVLRYSLEKIEESGLTPDLVVTLEETYPLRPPRLIDRMIAKLVDEGLDSLVAAREEPRRLWLREGERARDIGSGSFMPRQFKDNVAFVGLLGLGCVTHPSFIREGAVFGGKVGIFEVKDPFSAIEIRNEEALRRCAPLLAARDGGDNG